MSFLQLVLLFVIALQNSQSVSGYPTIFSHVYSSYDIAWTHKIMLPVHVRPGGITHAHDNIYYFSDLASGDVYQFNGDSDYVKMYSKGSRGSGGVGIAYDNGKIFVAGGGDEKISGRLPTLNVYDESSHDAIAQCVIPSAAGVFVNDVAILGEYAYWTDCYTNQLFKMHVPSLPDCHVETIELPYSLFKSGVYDEPSANGITVYKDGLIVSNTRLQTLFYIDANYNVFQLLDVGTVSKPAGLEMVQEGGWDVLYVTQPHDQLVSKWIVETMNDNNFKLHQVHQFQTHDFANPSDVTVFRDLVITCDVDLSIPMEVITYESYHLTLIGLKK